MINVSHVMMIVLENYQLENVFVLKDTMIMDSSSNNVNNVINIVLLANRIIIKI